MNFPLPQSIRSRVLMLFFLSTTAFAGTILYGLLQWQWMGRRLEIINRCYQDIDSMSDQILAVPLQQLEKEFDRLARDGALTLRATNTRLHLQAIQNALKKLQKKLTNKQATYTDEKSTLNELQQRLRALQQHTETCQNELISWQQGNIAHASSQLNKQHIQVQRSYRALTYQLQDRIIELEKQNIYAKERTFIIGGSFALLAVLLSFALAGVILRTLRPIADLTRLVQKLASGDYREKVPELPFQTGLEVAVLTREINLMTEAIVERDKDKERLAKTKRLATIGQMLAQITHEVRNPLNAMSLHAELLTDESLSEEGVDMLDTILQEIQRLEKITERYLMLSRRRTIEWSLGAPLHIIEEIHHLESLVLQQAPCTLSISGPNIPIWTDEPALSRTLRNILRNAVEAGASEIHVNLEYTQTLCTISVADNGEGIEKKRLQELFTPFYTTKAKGTGLGLVIAQQDMEDLGGQISCSSQPEKGTTFTIELPIYAHPPTSEVSNLIDDIDE